MVPFKFGAGVMVVSMYGLCFGCRWIGDSWMLKSGARGCRCECCGDGRSVSGE